MVMDFYNQMPRPVSVRFVNDLMMQPVDIFINDNPFIRGLMSRQMTQFIPLPAGNYNFKVYQTNTNQLLTTQNVQLDGNKLMRLEMEGNRVVLRVLDDTDQMMTLFPPQMGMPGQIPQMGMNQFGPLPQTGMPGQMPMCQTPQIPQMMQQRDQDITGQSRIRFINLSPNAPGIDVTTQNGVVLFRNVPYRAVSEYINVASGMHTFQLRETGTDRILLTVPNVILNPNDVKTLYAIGLLNGSPMFEVVILDDRLSF